jgi:hypothetical protein
MKKIFQTTMQGLSCLVVAGGLTVASCENSEELSTNQLAGKEVTIRAWGPTPLLRGDTIRFIGANLDRVTEVIFPENLSVAPIKVSGIELRAAAPPAAVDGYVDLIYPEGKVTTKTQITYADSVVYLGVRSEHTPAVAGDTVTITGDNLTSVTKAVFTSDVQVLAADFLEQTRYQIKLFLPDEAQTGEMYLLDGEAATYPVPLEVAAPSVTGVAPLADIKAGRDSITVSGALLNLAKEIVFAGGAKVAVENANPDQIKVLIPAEAKNGAITLVAKSGLEYTSASEITLLLPQSIFHAAADRYKAGSSLTISGDDLDLVTGVTFAGDADAEFTYALGSITVTIPEAATDGPVTLHCVAGDVATPDVTLVKPAVSAVAPASIQAGDIITITGNDLDLVAKVLVGGKAADTLLTRTDTEVTAVTPTDAPVGASAQVAVALANGVEVAAGAVEVTFSANCFIPTLPGEDAKIYAGSIFEFTVENGSQLTGVEVKGVAVQYILRGDKLSAFIPENASGATSLKLISANGDVTYQVDVIGGSIVEIFTGPLAITWSDGGRAVIPASAFSGLAAGAVMTIYFTQNDNWGQVQINNGAWAAIPFAELAGSGTITTNTYNDKSVTMQELVLTQEILDNIAANAATGEGDFFGAGIIIQGSDWTIDRITAPASGGGEVLWEGSTETGSWSGYVTLAATAFANAQVGDKIVVTCANVIAGAQWGIRDGSWSNIVDYDDIAGNSYEYAIDAAGLAALQASGGIFTGHDYTIAKIEIKNY